MPIAPRPNHIIPQEMIGHCLKQVINMGTERRIWIALHGLSKCLCCHSKYCLRPETKLNQTKCLQKTTILK